MRLRHDTRCRACVCQPDKHVTLITACRIGTTAERQSIPTDF